MESPFSTFEVLLFEVVVISHKILSGEVKIVEINPEEENRNVVEVETSPTPTIQSPSSESDDNSTSSARTKFRPPPIHIPNSNFNDDHNEHVMKPHTRSQSYQTVFLWKRRIFPFFADKLGRFIINTHLFLCYKHSSLTAKIGKPEK